MKNKEKETPHSHKDTILFFIKNNKIVMILLFLSFFSNSYLTYHHFIQNEIPNQEKGLKENELPFLSKRIFTENQNDIIINFTSLRNTLKSYIENENGQVGLYFEYLPSGVSIGVNDRDEIKLASLSKVPLVMSILKKEERGLIKLDDAVILKKENLDSRFGTLWKKGEGSKLTVKELIEICLKESDNTAYEALFGLLTTNEVNEVYDYLDITILFEGNNPLISPKSYSSIIRSLYLSSFLDVKNSDYVLEVLSDTLFKDKIPAGVPSHIKVSHKVGIFNDLDTKQNVYSDCGIVYIPQRPYILCIFVKNNEEDARKHMTNLSKIIFTYVSIVKRIP